MKAKVFAVTVSLGVLFSSISLAQTAFSITAGPTATNVAGTSATIRWSLTSVATGQVQYGPTASYGKVTTPELSYNYSTHIQRISGLASGTTYHFRVVSSNANGVKVVSPDSTFTTASATSGTSGSGLSITAGPTATNVTGTSATIRWSLTSVATGQVQYGPTASYGKVTTPELSYNYSTHIQRISGLASGTTYHFRVISKTASGVQVLSPDLTFTTASATSGTSGSGLSITAGPTATNVTGTSATIRWSLTSVATGQVQYGPTASYGKVTTPELSYNYSTHIQMISGLASGTTYHFRVISKTASGVQVLSPDSTFTTASLTSGSSGSTPSDTGSTPSGTGCQ